MLNCIESETFYCYLSFCYSRSVSRRSRVIGKLNAKIVLIGSVKGANMHQIVLLDESVDGGIDSLW